MEIIETFDSMKNEAQRRMKFLGIKDELISAFITENKLYCSDNRKIVDVPKDIQKKIDKWQGQYKNLVYHVIHSHFMCETYECLSVSCYKEDWDFEREIMKDNWVISHS